MDRNRMSDLKDHLFAALERLGDESLTEEQIAAEAKRAEAIVAVADQITESAKLQLSAARLFAEHGAAVLPHLPQIGKAPEGSAE
jgi:hypothetical protein